MKSFEFNKLIIIESLCADEPHTGTELYNDVKLNEYRYSNLSVELKTPHTKQEWGNLMDSICGDCIKNGTKPILHLEVHGSSDSLQFTDRSLISIYEVGEQLRKINIACGCNLLLTLGVCKGLYLLFNLHHAKPMPFCGAIGSFDDLVNSDIQQRFATFYDEFFTSLDLSEAYVNLLLAQTGFDCKYRYFPADEIFYKNYMEYLKINCTKDAVKARAKESIGTLKLANRAERRKKESEFIKLEKKKRLEYYRSSSKIYFMLDNFPENKERFNVPDTFHELKERCKNLIV